MTFTNPKIIACPYCNQLYNNPVITSFNTINSRYFTDGYMDGDFIPNLPSIVKCVNQECGKFFNVKEAEIIGEIPKNIAENSYPEEWNAAFLLGGYRIGIKELKEALEADFCKDKKNEIKVRSLLHKRYNDLFRSNRKHQLSKEERSVFINNIDRLIEYDENENEVDRGLYLAELYREKGDFDSCIEILSEMKNEDENVKLIKEKIYSQAKVQDDKVFNVHVVAIKKEYKCNKCGHGFILFDLAKMNNTLEYRHYKCKIENKVFVSQTKMQNPEEYYRLTFWQKLFKTKKPYKHIIPLNEIVCPNCNKTDVELFDPGTDKCIMCGEGNYSTVKWFN